MSLPVRTIVRAIAAVIVLAGIALPALFEVRLDPAFSLPKDVERPDPEQEARYERCVDRRTDEATRQAFEQADNPDVQNLMILMRQKDALDACRRQYPARRITVHEPFRIDLVDLRWRFGGTAP